MSIIFTHFWVLIIAVNTLNTVVYAMRSKRYIAENPSLAEGYRALIQGYFIWINIPWAVMAVGILTGKTSGFLDYLRPKDMNPYVILFYCSILFVMIAGDFWIFFLNGAEFLGRHPGFVTVRAGFSHRNVTSPVTIKILFLAITAVSLFAIWMIWTSNIPPPTFPE
ncbi:MAG: hypothetical protein AB9903_27780 [Vulcanimicrobiota bacterium]